MTSKNRFNIENCEIVVRNNELKGVLRADENCNDSLFKGNHISFYNTDVSKNEDFMFQMGSIEFRVNLKNYIIFPKELLTKDQSEELKKYNKVHYNNTDIMKKT